MYGFIDNADFLASLYFSTLSKKTTKVSHAITEKYPQALLEALVIHSFLGSLGYSLESQMFILFNDCDVFVLLKAEGKSLALRAGRAEYDTKEIVTLWKKPAYQVERGRVNDSRRKRGNLRSFKGKRAQHSDNSCSCSGQPKKVSEKSTRPLVKLAHNRPAL